MICTIVSAVSLLTIPAKANLPSFIRIRSCSYRQPAPIQLQNYVHCHYSIIVKRFLLDILLPCFIISFGVLLYISFTAASASRLKRRLCFNDAPQQFLSQFFVARRSPQLHKRTELKNVCFSSNSSSRGAFLHAMVPEIATAHPCDLRGRGF